MEPSQTSTAESVVLILFLLLWFAIPAVLAIQKGRNWFTWVTLALFLPLVSLLILVMLPSYREPKAPKLTKAKDTPVKDPAADKKAENKVPAQTIKKSYTEEFKKEVASTALTSGETLSSVASMYDVNPTLVRNWKEKYEAEIISETAGNKSTGGQTSAVAAEEMIDGVLADYEVMLMSNSVLHGLGIKGLVGTRLQAEPYDDDGIPGYICWIIVEATVSQKLSEDLKEQISGTVQDFVRENGFNEALSEVGADPDAFNRFPVKVELVDNQATENEKSARGSSMVNAESNGVENERPTLIWHIDRAKFSFSDPGEYKQWKKEKKVFFEFSPSNSDDGGEAVFTDPESAEDDFEITEDRGLVKISLEKDGPLITVWVGVTAQIVEDLDEETLNDWANDQGGWASCSIHLGEFDATIEEDDGGDWRFPENGED